MYAKHFLYGICIVCAVVLLFPVSVSHAADMDIPDPSSTEDVSEDIPEDTTDNTENPVPDNTEDFVEDPEELPGNQEPEDPEEPPEESLPPGDDNPEPEETPPDEEEPPEGESSPGDDNPEPEQTQEPDFPEAVQVIPLEDAIIQPSADVETLFTKSFDDYTVTEGLLLLIFVCVFCKFCIDMTAKIMNWRMY